MMPNECPFCGELIKEVEDITKDSGYIAVFKVHCTNVDCDMYVHKVTITVEAPDEDA